MDKTMVKAQIGAVLSNIMKTHSGSCVLHGQNTPKRCKSNVYVFSRNWHWTLPKIFWWLLKSHIMLGNAGKWLTRSWWFRKFALKMAMFAYFFQTPGYLRLPPVQISSLSCSLFRPFEQPFFLEPPHDGGGRVFFGAPKPHQPWVTQCPS